MEGFFLEPCEIVLTFLIESFSAGEAEASLFGSVVVTVCCQIVGTISKVSAKETHTESAAQTEAR